MEMVEKKKEEFKETSQKENKLQYRIIPTIYTTCNSKSKELNLEIHLPGVKKENVQFKILPELFDLRAKKDESTFYAISEYFPYEINPDTVEAHYENGMLEMKAKIKDPMDSAYSIKID